MNVLVVAAGGAIGAALRYLLGGWIQGRLGLDFPWGTFIVNVSGSLLIGVILGLVDRGALSSEARLFLAVGVVGGYTTFSTFSYETLQLIEQGNLSATLLNAFGQLALGLVAVYLGVVISRALGGVQWSRSRPPSSPSTLVTPSATEASACTAPSSNCCTPKG